VGENGRREALDEKDFKRTARRKPARAQASTAAVA
jgi:hypothetical protein